MTAHRIELEFEFKNKNMLGSLGKSEPWSVISNTIEKYSLENTMVVIVLHMHIHTPTLANTHA